MEIQTAETVEVQTMVSKGVGCSSSSESDNKLTIPLYSDYEIMHHHDRVDNVKLRRPVRPVDRQRMRPWLMELLDLGNVYGLRWTNRPQGVFQISWRHASRLGWNLETDGDVFERWARHTGIYKEGDPPEPKRWKANFRCALHSLHDVVELTNALERRGSEACRTYRFLHNTEEANTGRRRSKQRRPKEVYSCTPSVEEAIQEAIQAQQREQQHQTQHQAPVYEFVTTEIVTNDDMNVISEQEVVDSEAHDRVIVQSITDLSGEEEIGLHHDHDYLAIKDKLQKTIVLRQGIGSIVLHKEVFDAPVQGVKTSNEEDAENSTSLDQLANAAVDDNVGWNTILAPGIASSGASLKSIKQKFKAKISAKLKEDSRAAYNLKYLLTKDQEGVDEPSASASALLKANRKRKAESLSEDQPHFSISVGAEETVGSETTNEEETGEMFPFVSQKVTGKSPRRTVSPRILSGAKARRQRSKSEKTDSESTEPLMSSCLLLLEAATRLDNEEKGGSRPKTKAKSGVAARTSGYAGVKKKKIVKNDAIDSDIDSETSAHGDLEESVIINTDQELQMVLRKTLESLKNRKGKSDTQEVEQTITLNLAEDSQGEGEEIVVSNAEQAHGLFSGSMLHGADENQSTTAGQKMMRMAYVNESGNEIVAVDGIGKEEPDEYVEMVLEGGEDGVAYIQANSNSGELVIESDHVKDGAQDDDESTITLHIPAGSVLLQTSDGTPIGILDEEGQLTAFNSSEAHDAISLLTSEMLDSSMEIGISHEEVSSSEQESVNIKGVPRRNAEQIIVKQEVDEEVLTTATQHTVYPSSSAAVKVESLHPEENLHLLQDEQEEVSSSAGVDDTVLTTPDHSINCKTPCLKSSLLSDLTHPYTFAGILKNLKDAFFLHRSKSCICYATPMITETNSVKRLENVCKELVISMCFTSSLYLNAKHQLMGRKKVQTLHKHLNNQASSSRQQTVTSTPEVSVMDPTAPLSIGEIPLFATVKGESPESSP